MATKNKKITTRLKIKNWPNPKIKNHKDSHEQRLTRTHIFKILNTTGGENCESSWVQVFINQET